MAEINKPSGMNVIWAASGDILDPGTTKIQTGWGIEIPPRQWENYIQNKQDTFNAHVNQHGVVEWDVETEYQADKSYVQGPTNGTIYRCILTHTNQNPETDATNTYWIIAFASAGDFYTKTETDNLYLAKAANGSDILNAPTFRTNLSVYSKAETYTKTEVDAKTTVASTPQSQAWTSNTTLLTPLRLAEAFQGTNRSFATSGYQKLPGGLIIQWGTRSGDGTVTFPITFPTAILGFAQGEAAGAGADMRPSAAPTTSGFTVTGADPGSIYYYVVIGH